MRFARTILTCPVSTGENATWHVLIHILVLMQDSNKRAAAAAAAAAAAQDKTESKTITETRRFAGKDIQVWTQHPNSFCNCIAVLMRPLQAGNPATTNMVAADGTSRKTFHID